MSNKSQMQGKMHTERCPAAQGSSDCFHSCGNKLSSLAQAWPAGTHCPRWKMLGKDVWVARVGCIGGGFHQQPVVASRTEL